MTRRKTQIRRGCPERVGGMQNAKDRREALETIVRSFARPEWIERHVLQAVWQGSFVRPEHTRVAVADGRVVSALVMSPRLIRFGPAVVPAMSIGTVSTHDQHRNRGYGSAVMNDASEWMKDNGVFVAYLGGISNFYHRFGYYPFMAQTRAKFAREDARKPASRATLRAMRRNDIP